MALTPSTVRLDTTGRACGQGHIAAGKTCHKRGAFPTGKAIAAGLTAGAIGAVLLNKKSRRAVLGAPGAARRAAQSAVTEAVHRAASKPPTMRLTPRAFEELRPPSKTQRLHRAAQEANRSAERAMRKAAQAEIERAGAVGNAMYEAGKATRASLRSGLRTHNLTVEKLRRRYEPGYRRGRRDNYIATYATSYIDPALQRRDADGKKYTKVVTNPETGRKNRVRYGAKGYRIAPGTDKGDRYCARSFGDMKSEGYNCAGAERNTPLCLSRAKWKCSGKTSRRGDAALMPGKVLALPRLDAPESAQGKPCGASHIPKAHKCSKSAASTGKDRLKTAAKVALALGAVAGGAAIAKKFMSMEEWRNHPDNIRNKPKISPELGQQIEDEALAHGHKWDVQEKINARRLAELQAECGGGLGKILAPAKFDAEIPSPRCRVGAGSFGTYFVHPSQEYGIKVFHREDENADPGWESDRLDKAHAAGVNVPEPLSINATRDGTVTLRLRHLKNYTEAGKLYAHGDQDLRNAPLIIQIKAAREYRKLHTEGLAHGDIHGGNVLINPKAKRVGLVDFGYATQLDDAPHRMHNRDGVENLLYDLRRLPEFLGLPSRGTEFLDRHKGVLSNIETQAHDYHRSWEKFELGIKRYHDALEAELLWDDRRPRSRFVSGADQPRIPGLTRRILTANANTRQRALMERLQGQPTVFKGNARALGLKPAQLYRALAPERDARRARNRQQPFGTPLRAGS